MAKTKTLSKREKSSEKTSKTKAPKKPRLKPDSKAEEYSAVSDLKDRKFITEAIADALMSGDAEAVREILTAHLEQVCKALVEAA